MAAQPKAATRTGLTCQLVSRYGLPKMTTSTTLRVTHTWRGNKVEVFGELKRVEKLANQTAIEMIPTDVYEAGSYPFNPENFPVCSINTHRWSSYLGWDGDVRRGRAVLRFGMRKDTMVWVATWMMAYAPGSIHERLNNFKSKREESGYTSQRHAISIARDEMSKAFVVAGLTQHSTHEEFKAKRRELMLAWHPDRQPVSTLPPAEFKARSAEVTGALSLVLQYLNARDNRNQAPVESAEN